MVNIIIIVVWTLIVSAVGGVGGYFIYLKTRPNKIAWNAKIYTLGEGVRPPLTNKDGEIVSPVSLKDIRPYGKDILQRIEREHGLIIYRLKKLNAPTNEPTANCVDYWGQDDKEINILKSGDSYTVMTKGYDELAGVFIFRPLSYETSTMLQHQAELRKSRLKQEKDVLAQITPWVVGGMALLFLFGIGYMFIEANTEISENHKVAAEIMAEAQILSANTYREGQLIAAGHDPSEVIGQQEGLGKQGNPTEKIK